MSAPLYCVECGAKLASKPTPEPVRNCRHCGHQQRSFPTIVATCFVNLDDSFLWVRRAIEPKLGYWAIPGGYVEAGETLKAGAARELYEETGMLLPEDQLHFYTLGSMSFLNQIYVSFRATVYSDTSQPTLESSECRFISRKDCPWEELAYPEVNIAIEQAYEELESNRFGVWEVEYAPRSYNRRRIKDF